MDAERWEQVQALFFAALDRDPEAWGAFLDEACGDDDALRAEVDAMLHVHQDSQALAIENRLFTEQPPGPDPEALLGTHVGPYHILEKLGGGGMGVVYKARDTRLDRSVALKFLPPHLSANEEAKVRFIQEAKAASALDHPNIAVVHEIGQTQEGQLFIVMAYYAGAPLKQTIAQGPLPVDEAVALARQVAQGLATAHAAGIIHRDIKPANVIVTEQGIAKIVDLLPKTTEDLKAILQAYTVTITKENMKK